jgi:hypothetical protein
MVENGEGRLDYMRRRFSEAETSEDVERIEDELIRENIPRGTVSRVKSDMKKNGELPQSSASGSLVESFGRSIATAEAPSSGSRR